MRISDWSSDVCSSDLQLPLAEARRTQVGDYVVAIGNPFQVGQTVTSGIVSAIRSSADGRYRYVPMISRKRSEGPTLCSDNLSTTVRRSRLKSSPPAPRACGRVHRSEEHTSELQSLMRISYAVFCLKKNKQKQEQNYYIKE